MVSKKNKSGVDVFRQALDALKLKPTDVYAHREYSDRIVIVSKSGQKRVWQKAKQGENK